MLRYASLLAAFIARGSFGFHAPTSYGGPPVTEIHEVCSAEEGFQARCGPGANCLVLGGVPTCHCVRDAATGLPLAGNPYRGCTWDLSGRWELHWKDEMGMAKPLADPFGNEPFIIQIDRTDAVLKTQYMTGAIFVITAVTGAASGMCGRVFLDVNDNQSVILELAEGFVDKSGRNMFFRKRFTDMSLAKKYPKDLRKGDAGDLSGGWKKWDGSKVKVVGFKRNRKGNPFRQGGGNAAGISPGWAYWYNDDSFGAPAIRLSTAIFLDETLPFEMAAFDTTNRFVQMGWFGYLALGASTIHIISPADGKQLFGLRRITDFPSPLAMPAPQPTTITLTGHDQIHAIANAGLRAVTPVIPTVPVQPVISDFTNSTGLPAFEHMVQAIPAIISDVEHIVDPSYMLTHLVTNNPITSLLHDVESAVPLRRQLKATTKPISTLDLSPISLIQTRDRLYTSFDRLISMGAVGNYSLHGRNLSDRQPPYPTPNISELECQADSRKMSLLPRTTFDDLLKFNRKEQHDGVAKFKASVPSGPRESVEDIDSTTTLPLFKDTYFFGLEDDGVSEDSPFEYLWRKSARRLHVAEKSADESILARFT